MAPLARQQSDLYSGTYLGSLRKNMQYDLECTLALKILTMLCELLF